MIGVRADGGWRHILRGVSGGGGRISAIARGVAVVVWLCAVTTSGVVVALRGFGEDEYALGPARVDVRSSLSERGTVDAYIPLVDWGVRAHPFSAPVNLSVRLISIDRKAAAGAVSKPGGARARLLSIEHDAPVVAHRALRRAALAALIGGTAGGLVGGLGLCAVWPRRRLIPVGGAAGLGLTSGGIVLLAIMLAGTDYGAFRSPTFYAHGGELPKLLAVSDQFSAASSYYESSYQQALAGIDTLIGAAAGQEPAHGQVTILLGSDIHGNWLTLPAFARYADRSPVFLVGDYAQQGTPVEAAIVDRAAHLGRPLVAVSGNHDTPLLMRRFAETGAIVLTHRGVLTATGAIRPPVVVPIDGFLVAGYEDPLERRAGSYGHRLDFTPDELAAYQQAVNTWFDELEPRPQIVLVHDFRVARTLRLHVAAESDLPLVILTGHDHRQHIDQTGNVVEIDGGTLGAGGVFGIGSQPAGFARITLDETGWPAAIDMISADPLTGDASARHTVLTVATDTAP